MKPGSCGFPYFGIEFAVVDPTVSETNDLATLMFVVCQSYQSGKELEGTEVEGVLCIKKRWPSIGIENVIVIDIFLKDLFSEDCLWGS